MNPTKDNTMNDTTLPLWAQPTQPNGRPWSELTTPAFTPIRKQAAKLAWQFEAEVQTGSESAQAAEDAGVVVEGRMIILPTRAAAVAFAKWVGFRYEVALDAWEPGYSDKSDHDEVWMYRRAYRWCCQYDPQFKAGSRYDPKYTTLR